MCPYDGPMGGRGGSGQRGAENAPTTVSTGPRGPLTDDEVRAKVDAAVIALESEPHAWVILTRLRDHLGEEVNRTQLDRVLLHTQREGGGYNIAPESNQKALTLSDRESAVTIGGQQKHLIARDRSRTPYVPFPERSHRDG